MAIELDDREIIALIEGEINSSSGYQDSEISAQREKAMEYFYGEPFGNEEDGRSQVVVTDVQDTIMWMMPSLMRIFTAGDRVVKFEPEGPEDEDAAEQATKYVNHVFYKQNNGFMILYNLFLDALINKVGIVKHYWEELDKVTSEEYSNLSDNEFRMLEQDENLELDQHTEMSKMVPVPDPMTGQMVEMEEKTHDAVFLRSNTEGRVTIENVPPEEFLINTGAKTVEDASFICHRSRKTRSDLIAMGFDEDIVGDLAATSNVDGITTSEEFTARHSYDSTGGATNQSSEESEELIEVFESYLNLDPKESGTSLLYKVTHAGSEVLDCEPIDYKPFSTVCPIPIPHKFFGLSVAETVEDIQLIRSTLTRNLLDNMYLANNGRFQVVEGQVNIDDLLTNRPGGIVRTRSPQALQPIQTPALQNYSFEMLEYWDNIKSGRTGVNPATQGLSADVLKSHVTAGAITGALTNGQGRIELIARVFADTGVRNIFKSIYNLVQRFENRKKIVRVHNQFAQIDPSSWKEDLDVSIEVGLGYGDQDIRMNNLSTFATLVEKVAQQTEGIINPDNIYNLMREIAEEMGIKNVDKFISPPSQEPPEPNVQEQAMQAQAQALMIEAQASQVAAQVKVKEAEIKAARLELERAEIEHTMALKREELKLKGIELGYEMSSGENVKAN
tara:strand:- start:1387 stop:3405 length:2019 start_codon:yes stop_codon:yes gene_type:complete